MSDTQEDPRCPECGEPIGITATYCMHCSTDLSGEHERADANQDEAWDGAQESGAADTTTDGTVTDGRTGTGTEDQVLDPDGIVDNSLTVIVGIVGGIIIGFVATLVLAFLTDGTLAVLGIGAWLVSTAHLVRQRTVQSAVSRGAYGVAIVLLLMPLIPLSPFVEMDGSGRAVGFVFLLIFFGFFAAVAAAIGYVASRFVPKEPGTGEAGGETTAGR